RRGAWRDSADPVEAGGMTHLSRTGVGVRGDERRLPSHRPLGRPGLVAKPRSDGNFALRRAAGADPTRPITKEMNPLASTPVVSQKHTLRQGPRTVVVGTHLSVPQLLLALAVVRPRPRVVGCLLTAPPSGAD